MEVKKILLIGEYSSLFSNLKRGFEKINKYVEFYHDGDGNKKIPYTKNSYKLKGNSKYKIFNSLIYPLFNIKKLKEFDVVYIINPKFVNIYLMKKCFKTLKKNNKKVYILSCGGSFELFQTYKLRVFDYYMYDHDNVLNRKERSVYEKRFIGKILSRIENYIFKNCDGIIPSAYEYSVPFEKYKNLKNVIPFPFDISSINSEKDKKENKKIIIYHGITRAEQKGSYYITEAMNNIKNKYPDRVEIIINEIMPYDQYKKAIEKADIIMDQCKSYAWGMNAILSMAEGKVVFSGAEKETLNAFGLEKCPIINIRPSVQDIEDKLEELILNPNKIKELSKEGINFVKEFHDCKKIAEKYLEVAEE